MSSRPPGRPGGTMSSRPPERLVGARGSRGPRLEGGASGSRGLRAQAAAPPEGLALAGGVGETSTTEGWAVSAAHFEDSMNCYERAALFAEQGLAKMLAMKDIDEDFRARQIEGFNAAIKEDRSQQYASAFNAANHYMRAGEAPKAKRGGKGLRI